jgi:hypothetical protein
MKDCTSTAFAAINNSIQCFCLLLVAMINVRFCFYQLVWVTTNNVTILIVATKCCYFIMLLLNLILCGYFAKLSFKDLYNSKKINQDSSSTTPIN